MKQLNLSPMQQHEITMRQMVEQIHLGKLNMDQATVRFNVHRKTVRHWVNKVEKEAQTNQKTVSELPNLPPSRNKKLPHRSPPLSEDQPELRAKIHALEQELEVAKFKSLYYSTLVKVAEQELGIDIEKKPPGPGPLPSHPIHAHELFYSAYSAVRRLAWVFTTSVLSILAASSQPGRQRIRCN